MTSPRFVGRRLTREVESRSQAEPGARRGPDSNFLYQLYHPDSVPIISLRTVILPCSMPPPGRLPRSSPHASSSLPHLKPVTTALPAKPPCRTPEFGIKDYLGQRLAERMWQRYVHVLPRGTKPVYRQSSRSTSLCCPHLLAHSYCLGAGLSVLLVTTARTVLGWMNGGCSKGQVQVPLLYAEYSLAAHFP